MKSKNPRRYQIDLYCFDWYGPDEGTEHPTITAARAAIRAK